MLLCFLGRIISPFPACICYAVNYVVNLFDREEKEAYTLSTFLFLTLFYMKMLFISLLVLVMPTFAFSVHSVERETLA